MNDIDDMIKQVTEEAKMYILSDKNMQAALDEASKAETVEDGVSMLYNKSIQHAEENNGDFGTLFQAELDAVDWESIVKEEMNG